MIYVMSDVHGCYRQYLDLLKQAKFCNEDTLFVLGDVLDKGDDPIKLLQDMSMRENVIPILGNHEYMAASVLQDLMEEITEDTCTTLLSPDFMESYGYWINDGGDTTLKQFLKLKRDEREALMEYLEEFSLYEEISAGEKDYVLVHAGIEPYVEGKPLEDYKLQELIFKNPYKNADYFKDKTVIYGHTPTFTMGEEWDSKIYIGKNMINIDCGAVYGRALAMLCLDDGKCYHSPSEGK
jgi:serine/threonine protein phosphatase 1